MKYVLYTFLLLITWFNSFCQNYVLDSSFGTNGIVTSALYSGINSGCFKLLLQEDGKIISLTFHEPGTQSYFSTDRYNSDGTVDVSFNSTGESTYSKGYFLTNDPIGNPVVCALLQPDGKILEGGSLIFSDSTYSNFGVIRYNVNGRLDSSFGDSGAAIFSFGGPRYGSIGTSMALQNDDKIIVGGYINNEAVRSDYMGVIRFNPDGVIDSSFGSNGHVSLVIDTGFGLGSEVLALAVQNDGKILVAGEIIAQEVAIRSLVVLRLNIDGSLDSTYGVNGLVNSPLGFQQFYSMLIQNDNQLIVAGVDRNFLNGLLRLDTTGVADNSFGINGESLITFGTGNNFYANQLIFDTSNAILAGGQIFNGTTDSNFYAAMRLTPNGKVDSTFCDDGVLNSNFNPLEYGRVIALQPDSKILLAGGGEARGYYNILRFKPSQPTGVIEISNDQNTLFAYPNPMNKRLYIDYELPKSENISIELLDIAGKNVTILLNNSERLPGLNHESLEIPEKVANGNYILKLNTPTGWGQIKVIKRD